MRRFGLDDVLTIILKLGLALVVMGSYLVAFLFGGFFRAATLLAALVTIVLGAIAIYKDRELLPKMWSEIQASLASENPAASAATAPAPTATALASAAAMEPGTMAFIFPWLVIAGLALCVFISTALFLAWQADRM